MSLDSELKTAISLLRSNELENEEEVKQAVIRPILLALGWSAHPRSIKPEYSTGQGRVDYALLCDNRPQVFIEAKRRGALDVRAEGQLFRYASNRGIPLLVLTDGYYWDFFLSMADGPPEERRFYRLELSHEDEIPQYMEFLETCLRKHRVASGDARRSAETCLERNRERERARKAIPSAWSALLKEPGELLCGLLADKVQHVSGAKPDPDDVGKFLMSLPRVPERSGRQGLSTEVKPRKPSSTTNIPEYGSVSESRRKTMSGASSQPSQNETQHGESLQDIVRDFMFTVLEKFPETLNEEMIGYLEVTKNPLGLKISNHTLIRRISEGRAVGRHTRYWKRAYAGQWYVCSEWWSKDHHHNAKMLVNWVDRLIADVDQPETKDCLVNIRKRFDAYAEHMQSL